ncbi:MAG: chlorosome envelope protein H [Chlorobium sp.]
MAAEELSNPAGTPASLKDTETGAGNGDMAQLIGSMGSLIDSTIVSVQEAISSVSSTTGQIIEGVSATIQSEPVQGVINSVSTVTGQLINGVTSTINAESIQGVFNSVSSATGQLIDGVAATINSQPVQEIINNVSSVSGQVIDGVSGLGQNSFQDLGKLWTSLLENMNAAGSANQIQNLFNNVSAGLGQLMNNSFMPGAMGNRDNRSKKDVTEIRFTPKGPTPSSVAAKEVVFQPAVKVIEPKNV